MHTIFALSSGHGRAGVAVIRVSGPAAGVVLDRMAPPRPKPRFAAFRRIRHPATGDLVDEALVLWFPAPRSETGEDVAELQVHGGTAVIRATLSALALVPGCRLAEPGEFARRAFANGRLDLAAAEGLADLVDADTEAQRRQALLQAGGALGRRCEAWRTAIVEARALVEAAIDFSDEPDVAADALTRGTTAANALAAEIDGHLADAHRGEIVREGFRVVLAGPPNAGKSSLFNALARRDAAIVSPEPGTTRDVLEVRLDLGGYAVVLSDTAGLRDAAGAIEAEGMRRAVARAGAADLVIWLVDGTTPVWTPPAEITGPAGNILPVWTKLDLARPPAGAPAGIAVSAATGAGLATLVERIGREVAARLDGPSPALVTNIRHHQCLADASAELARAGTETAPELIAESLRRAADALGRVVGRIDAEAVLDRIFSRFCIGK